MDGILYQPRTKQSRGIFQVYVGAFLIVAAFSFGVLWASDLKETASVLLGVFAGGLVTWLLNIQDERRRDRDELETIATGLYGEMLYILRSALIARTVWRGQAASQERTSFGRMRKFDQAPPPIYTSLTDKIARLPADVLGAITTFYNSLEMIRRDIARFDDESARHPMQAETERDFAARFERVCQRGAAAIEAIEKYNKRLVGKRTELLKAYLYDEPVDLVTALKDSSYRAKEGAF
ncbi:MAG: hypothetical protein AB7E79_09690 [Rhodospirillaceae bacterium]